MNILILGSGGREHAFAWKIKQSPLCNQLFIDEGFINFDKYNLSIVPSFLKSLLHYFNTIVILSHIDIIQDSVDETANICFNHKNGRSSITY
jgi:DNA repair exonuclease SbcCD ATPase subunit